MDEQRAWAYIGRALAEEVGSDDIERAQFRDAAGDLGVSPGAVSAISGGPCDECVEYGEA